MTPRRSIGAVVAAFAIALLLAGDAHAQFWKAGATGSAAPPLGVISGLTLSNNGADAVNDIDVAAGEASSDDAAAANRVRLALTSGLTKQLDAAWVAGTNQGCRDTGAIANGTWHYFVISTSSGGSVDVLCSTSATAPTMPGGYSKKRRIGAVLREAAALVAFKQYGDEFYRAPILDVNVTAPGTAAVTRTLSVPAGISVSACVNGVYEPQTATSAGVRLSDLALADLAPSAAVAPLADWIVDGAVSNNAGEAARLCVRTNTSAQIRSRVGASVAGTIFRLSTYGWIDTRDRN